MNNIPYSSPNAALRTTKTIHIAMILGQLVFGVVVFSLDKKPTNHNLQFIESNDTLMYVAIGLLGVVAVVNTVLTRAKLGAVSNLSGLKQKLSAYQTALIIRYALIEGPNMFLLVSYMLTGNINLLYTAGVVLIIMVLLRPSKDHFMSIANLTSGEQRELEN